MRLGGVNTVGLGEMRLVWAGIVAIAAGMAVGQAAHPQQAAKSTGDGLSATPITLETLGLTMRLPEGCVVTKDESSPEPRFLVDDTTDPPRFRLQIQLLRNRLDAPTAEAQIAAHLARAEAANAGVQVLADESIVCDGIPGRILYTSVALDAQTTAVTGWMLIPAAPGDFFAFTVIASKQTYGSARRVLDRVFESVKILTREQADNLRATRGEAGRSLLARIDETLLRSMGKQQGFWRVHAQKGVEPDHEVGWQRLFCREGAKAEVDPSRKPPFVGDEARLGLLVCIQSQSIDQVDPTAHLDTESRYWLSWDRLSEMWLTRFAERHGGAMKVFSQLGVREAPSAGAPRGRLHVATQGSSAAPSSAQAWPVPPEIYLSQAEGMLLGWLLPRDGSHEGEFGVYSYDARTDKLPQRILDWRRGAKEGEWILVSRPALDAAPDVSTFDSTGAMIRRIQPDGVILERTTPTELAELWKSKGISPP